MSSGSVDRQPVRPDDRPTSALGEGTAGSTGGDTGVPGSPTAQHPLTGASQPRRRRLTYPILTLVMAGVVILAGVIVLEFIDKPGGNKATLLTKKGQIDIIPVNNSDAIVVHAVSPSTIEGNVAIIYVVVFYTMNASQFEHLVKTMIASEYEYTSGPVQNRTNYPISVAVPAGWTYFVLTNPDPVQTLVGFNTALELVPG